MLLDDGLTLLPDYSSVDSSEIFPSFECHSSVVCKHNPLVIYDKINYDFTLLYASWDKISQRSVLSYDFLAFEIGGQ